MNTHPTRTIVAALLAAGFAARAQAQNINPSWVHGDTATNTATVAIIAGDGGVNGGMNFNGAINGQLTLDIPAGWNVVVNFRNADQMQPHSVIIIPAVSPVPATAPAPAFPGATSRRAMQGTATGGHETFHFTADHPGEFLIFCGVPGHGAAGMWLKMHVGTDVHQPAFVKS